MVRKTADQELVKKANDRIKLETEPRFFKPLSNRLSMPLESRI